MKRIELFPGSLADLESLTGEKYKVIKDDGRLQQVRVNLPSSGQNPWSPRYSYSDLEERFCKELEKLGADASVHTYAVLGFDGSIHTSTCSSSFHLTSLDSLSFIAGYPVRRIK